MVPESSLKGTLFSDCHFIRKHYFRFNCRNDAGMSFADAALHYTRLTVGDGIVNQIGSLMLAISTGIIVTRVFDGSPDTVTEGIFKELLAHEVVVYALGGLFIAMGILLRYRFYHSHSLAEQLSS